MKDFTIHIPTKIIFGKGKVSETGQAAAAFGKRALLVYGRSSAKETGLYDRINRSLKEAGIQSTEHGGVKPNPELSHAEEGIALGKSEKIDLIVALGGGSVIDEAKGIAIGCKTDVPLWDFYTRDAVASEALPIIAVQTMPATSSEMNSIAVLTNDRTRQKFSCHSEWIYPKVSILDPETTLSIPLRQTAYACTDIIAHLMEGYFTSTDPWAPVQDGYAEGIMKAVKLSMDRLIEDPKDYQARAAVMWAGALAWNGLGKAGVEGAGIPNHMLEHPLSALHDITHGAGLSIIIPAWLKYKKDEIAGRIEAFAKNVLARTLRPEETINVLENWYKKIGTPTRIGESGIDNPDIEKLTSQALELCEMWGVKGYTAEDIKAIYRLAL